METADFWTNVGLILGGVLLASVTYFKSKNGGRTEPHAAAMGLIVDRDTVRTIAEDVGRIADALESLADRKQDHMSTTIDKILETMKEAESRKPPRRPP